MKETIEAGILIILVLIGLLLLMEIIRRYVKGLVNSSDGSSHQSPTEPRSGTGRVKVGEAKSPFVAQSYRDMISLPLPEEDTNEEEETKLDVARRNERSLAPDEDNPFVQDVRDYAAFHRSICARRVAPRDKRLVMEGLDKVLGTEFETYYKEEVDELRKQLVGLDSYEVDTPTDDTTSDTGGFQVEMPVII